MRTEQLYFDDPLCLDFIADVSEIITTEKGKTLAILSKTYFYPTSGGQEHDKGSIGDAIVLDVQKMEDGRIVHILDREISPGSYPASIDRSNRWQNMQAHTAQHILSRAFETELDLETLSANINADTPSTIDLDASGCKPGGFSQVENKANSIVFENLTVKSYYITDEEISKIPFRKPPKVSGKIRVVEVEGFDYSACGGTHCPQTGMVGIIKIIRSEVQNKKLRVYFVAGFLALKMFQNTLATVTKLSSTLETSQDDLIFAVQKQLENLHNVRSELELVRSRNLITEADLLARSASEIGSISIIARILPDKKAEELRKLVAMIRSKVRFVVALGSIDGMKLSMVVGCSDDLQFDAREILRSILSGLNGKGGGDKYLAQGGCVISTEVVGDIFETVKKHVLDHPITAG